MSQSSQASSIKEFVLAMGLRCASKFTPEEQRAREQDFEAGVQRAKQATAHARETEKRRNTDAWLKHRAEKAEMEAEQAHLDGKIEVYVDPGPTWDMDWFNDVVAYKLPSLNPKYVVSTLGVNAILFGLGRLESRIEQGRTPMHPAKFVLREAEAVMDRERTRYVPEAVAEEQPDLIVKFADQTFAGKMLAAWEARQRLLNDGDADKG